MEKPVMIQVTSLQRDEDGKEEKISLETPGTYREDGGVRYVSYEETELAGLAGTTTTLVLYDDHVQLLREGTLTMQQEYRIGESHKSLYQTPMGPLEITAVTREIDDTIADGKGRMRLSYDVELKGLFNHLNEIIIELREDSEHSWKSETN